MRTDYLYRKVCRLSTLRSAWQRVQEADGCAGVDGVTISSFSQDLEDKLSALSSELSHESYEPLPLVRFFIAKTNGGQRALSVPSVRDRVAQNAVINITGPLFEKEFDACSFAYRKGRSVKQALQQIDFLHECGFVWVVDGDITSYFDNVDHGLLMSRVADLIASQRVLDLIRSWIAARVYDGRQITIMEKGLPQGAPISPLLANLYLDAFDDQMLSQGQKLVRFADDFVVLCKSRPRAESALKLTKKILTELRLSLSDEKTRITNFTEGFKYLGATFLGGLTMTNPPSHGAADGGVLMPPPLPLLRPVTVDPFNSALRDALRDAFDDVAQDEIPSFFKRQRETTAEPPAASAEVIPVTEISEVASENGPPLVARKDQSSQGKGGANADSLPNPESKLADTNGPSTPSGFPPPSLLTLRTLYIHEHGATIRCEDEHLRVFNQAGAELLSLPAFKIDQLVLFGNSQVTTGAMKFCLRHNIPIIVLNGMGRFFGVIESTGNQNVLLQQKQFARLADPDFVLTTAHQITAAKISNSRALLQRRHRDKPDNKLAQAINELLVLKSRLSSASTLDEIRGYEGAAAASYFNAFGCCVPQSFGFTKRTRQPPLDPVNALLSFGYTLLFYNIFAITRARGLSPYVGNLHALRQGHPALCSDLIEELRAPVVDSLVASILNKMVFSPADFYYDEEFEMPESAGAALDPTVGNSKSTVRGCFLTDQARRTFVAQFELRMNTLIQHPVAKMRTTWRGCIDLQVTAYIKALRGELPVYVPMEIR